MKIVANGSDDEMRPFSFRMDDDVHAIGIRDDNLEVVIEVQDLTRTVYLYATFAEIERIYNFCKQGR